MSDPSPRVFISATSQDLHSCRQLVKEGLLTLGCVPVEQTNFPPDYRTVREMLGAKIADCDAVVHIVGECYGAEPAKRDPATLRRSYTQMEYDLARELKKPVYVFICGEQFPYDKHPPEEAEKQQLQMAHRIVLATADTLRYKVGSHDDLSLRIRELQTRIEHLQNRLKGLRRFVRVGLIVGIVGLVAVVSIGGWFFKSYLDRQRGYLKKIAGSYLSKYLEAGSYESRYLEPASVDVESDEERFDDSVRAEANNVTRDSDDLHRSINVFIAATRFNPLAGTIDRALADFAQKKFVKAAAEAGRAVKSAHAERTANQAAFESADAIRREWEAYDLQVQSLFAAHKLVDAAEVLATAIEASASHWSEINHLEPGKYEIGVDDSVSFVFDIHRVTTLYNEWIASARFQDIAQHQEKMLTFYRAAIQYCTRKHSLQGEADVRASLAISLGYLARASTGTVRAAYYAEAVDTQRLVLDYCVKFSGAPPPGKTIDDISLEDINLQWANAQFHLASALANQAMDSIGTERAQIIAEAIGHYSEATRIFSRRSYPAVWANIQSAIAKLERRRVDAPAVPDRAR